MFVAQPNTIDCNLIIHVDCVLTVTLVGVGGVSGCYSYFSKTFDNYWYLFATHSVFCVMHSLNWPLNQFIPWFFLVHFCFSKNALMNAHISLLVALKNNTKPIIIV